MAARPEVSAVAVVMVGTVGLGLAIAAYFAVRRFAAKASSVVVGVGEGGLPVIRLRHASGALADVYLHGATVTRYANEAGVDVLWLSSGAKFDGKNAIRGGIPLVFPQFGPKADALLGCESMSQHGFVRKTAWEVDAHATEVTLSGDCRAVLRLGDSEATRAKWPHKFALEYTVTLMDGLLRTALKITNLDDDGAPPFQPQALLHTYFRVDEARETEVDGLACRTYLDQLTGATLTQGSDPITFVGETDRVYDGGHNTGVQATRILTMTPTGARPPAQLRVALEAQHVEEFGELGTVATDFPPDVVVWNPHVAKAKAMGDFDDDGWMRMCCIEPGILNTRRPTVAPGNSLVLAQTIAHVPPVS